MKKYGLIILVCLLVGCVSSGRFSRLSVPADTDTIPFEIDIPYTSAVEFVGFKYGFKHIYDLA